VPAGSLINTAGNFGLRDGHERMWKTKIPFSVSTAVLLDDFGSRATVQPITLWQTSRLIVSVMVLEGQ
jgi:hypothetical protein